MIQEGDIERIGKLSRISLTNEEKQSFAKDLGKILEYVSVLKNISPETVSRDSREAINIFREDILSHETGQYTEKILEEAPDTERGFIKVKKILS